jgi:anti-sigma B factor antagonist
MNEPSITTRDDESGAVVAEVAGDIDMSTVAGLRNRLYELADSGQPVIVDLERVTFMDSTGLGVLVGTARRAEAHGTSLHAVCSQDQTLKLLWLTGVDSRIPVSTTVGEALALLNASGGNPD